MVDQSRSITAGDTYRFRIEGMVCGGCERRVETAIAKLDGIEDVSANASVGTVDVTPKEGTPLRQSARRLVSRPMAS
ncbi:heavy-metal-associated domain-containing protein [Halomonas sp. 11-S5]|uniref:heavy-metal-associated domain-containing protein n=1 Tax=Halomonas sp. 11-S5 TaxID=2994064 RepID=UPI0024695423|nr:heavy-metal-associated domain-containing protein [Halomonas sp. 11-S5]